MDLFRSIPPPFLLDPHVPLLRRFSRQASGEAQLLTGYQEVRLQERSRCLAMGSTPASITAVIQDELVDTMRPGGESRSEIVGRM